MASYRLIGPNVIQIRENIAGRISLNKITDEEKNELKSQGYDLFPMYFLDDDWVRQHVAFRKNPKTI